MELALVSAKLSIAVMGSPHDQNDVRHLGGLPYEARNRLAMVHPIRAARLSCCPCR
jgi:hypothetical protein